MFINWKNKIKEGNFSPEEVEILFQNIRNGVELAGAYTKVFEEYCKEKDIALTDIQRCYSVLLLSISSLYCVFGKMDENFLDPESMQLFSMLTRRLFTYLKELEKVYDDSTDTKSTTDSAPMV